MSAKELKVFGETVLMPVSNIVNDDGTQWTPPTVSTELVNLGTLSTSGTLTADQVTQIGTTTIGVTARASVNSVTRFYERVNISGTTATLVSADDDALHVLTVNLSTRAYTLSDVALGSGGSGGSEVVDLGVLQLGANTISSDIYQAAIKDSCIAAKATIMSIPMYIPKYTSTGSMALFVLSSNQDGVFNTITIEVENTNAAVDMQNLTIPAPSASDNGKVLGVANGAYALQAASGGTQLYRHDITVQQARSGQTTSFSVISTEASQYSSVTNITGNVVHISGYVFDGTDVKTILAKPGQNSWCLVDSSGTVETNVSLSGLDNEIQSYTVTQL